MKTGDIIKFKDDKKATKVFIGKMSDTYCNTRTVITINGKEYTSYSRRTIRDIEELIKDNNATVTHEKPSLNK